MQSKGLKVPYGKSHAARMSLDLVKGERFYCGTEGHAMRVHLQTRPWSEGLTAHIAQRDVLLPGRRVRGARNPAYFTLRRNDLRTRLCEYLAAQEHPRQFAIDVATRLDTGDDFLPNITALGIAEGGLEIGFKRQRLLRHVTPIDGNAGFNAHDIQHL